MTGQPGAPRTRRRTRWLRALIPAVLIVAWVVLAGIGGPTFGKLSGVSKNDQASFLPASAESTEVAAWQKRFTDSTAVPAVVLFVSDTRIPPSALAGYAKVGTQLGEVDGVQAPEPGQKTSVAGPIPSKDGQAVEFLVPVADGNAVNTVVSGLRRVAQDAAGPGVAGYVTGPAGFLADLVDAFGGIDGILLVVAVAAVFVILLLVYRAVLLPILVLLTALFALTGAIVLVYLFALWGWITLSGQSQGILSILVIGAATDYSLLLVARFREALEQTQSRWDAVLRAWRAALEPIVASGATVIIALLCLLFSDLNSNRSVGPVGALGIAFALLAALTLLPALLAVFGRAAFWPFRPKFRPAADTPATAAAATGLEGAHGVWRRVGGAIARRPRTLWIAAFVLLAACVVVGLPQLKASGVAQTDLVLGSTQSVAGQKALARHFDAGSGSPVLIVADRASADSVLAKTRSTPGIGSAALYTGASRPGPGSKPVVKDGRVLIQATLTNPADSDAATDTVRHLRRELPSIDRRALVGGTTATNLDTNDTAQADLAKIIPIVLAVIFVILILLLRSILAPLVLIATVVLSYAAALGVSALVFDRLFRFPGADPSVPLFGFVFLVALGVDYNIFLMTRVREESLRIGTRPGILRGLSMTGSVITSAGIVLAATFAALSVIPILFLVQISFIVAFGVLLDTVIVRSLLVPAACYDIGRTIWWPSRLARAPQSRPAAAVLLSAPSDGRDADA